VYASSSKTFCGLLIRFGRGGGGISAVSDERFASAREEDDVTSMLKVG